MGLVQDQQDWKWQRQTCPGHVMGHPLNPHDCPLLATPLHPALLKLSFLIAFPGCCERKVRNIWESAPQTRYCSRCREFNPWSPSPFLVKERPLSSVLPPSSSGCTLSGPDLCFSSLWHLPGLTTGHQPGWGDSPKIQGSLGPCLR